MYGVLSESADSTEIFWNLDGNSMAFLSFLTSFVHVPSVVPLLKLKTQEDFHSMVFSDFSPLKIT